MNCQNMFGMNLTKVINSEDRFYKYKTANCTSVPIVVCEELLTQESLMLLFNLMDEFYLKVFNVKLEYVPISFNELTTSGNSILQVENMSSIMFPVELSDIARDGFWYYSPVFLTSELLLITGPPTEVEKYSMSFLILESSVSYLLVLCIFALPLLAKLSEFVTNTGQKRRQPKSSVRQKVRNFLNLSWDFVCIFFYEPFIRVPKCISWRIIVGSWLIAILIISIFMGSALKTKLYSTEHILIDTLESFSKYTNAKIGFIPSDNAASYFEQWEKYIMESQPKLSLAWRAKHMAIYDVLDVEYYQHVFLGRSGLFIPQFYLYNLLSILLAEEPDIRKLTFYFNAKRIKNLLFVFPVSNEFKRCAEFIEQINLGMYVATETKLAEYLFFKNDFYISRVVWKKPTKTLSKLTMNETYGTFMLFVYGVGLATATLVSEVIIKLTCSCYKRRLF